MQIPEQTPPERRKVPQWTHDPPESEKGYNGWLAGPPIWLNCHYIGRSVPCYFEMSKGRLDCPYCHPLAELKFQGYTPIYRDTHRGVFVILQENVKHIVAAIRPREPVYLWRLKQRGSAVAIRRVEDGKWWKAPTDNWRPPNILPSLFTVWKEPVLKQWMEANWESLFDQPAGSENATPLGPVASAVPVDTVEQDRQWGATKARLSQKAERLGREQARPIGDTLDGVTDAIERRAATEIGTKPNGKHPAGKGGAK